MKNSKFNSYINSPDFIDFYCYREDKWLQNAELEEKLIAVFGSVKKAINEFETFMQEMEGSEFALVCKSRTKK